MSEDYRQVDAYRSFLVNPNTNEILIGKVVNPLDGRTYLTNYKGELQFGFQLNYSTRKWEYYNRKSGALETGTKEINGETYNLADPESVLTIAQLAKLVAETAGCRLVYGVPTTGDIKQRSPILNQVLDTKKIENLGWRPAFCVEEGISHTLTIRRELFYDGR